MLRSIKELEGCSVAATDGPIGHTKVSRNQIAWMAILSVAVFDRLALGAAR